MSNDQEKKKVLREFDIKEFQWDLEGFPKEKHDDVKAKDVTFDWDAALDSRKKNKETGVEKKTVASETKELLEESKAQKADVFNWSQGHTTKLDKEKVKWAPQVEQITAEELVEIQMNAAIEDAMQKAEALKAEEDAHSDQLTTDPQYLPKGYEERAERDVKLHKFYTFNKKNAEFQALLDQEYERLREKIRLEAEEEAKLQVKMAAFGRSEDELADVTTPYLEQIKAEEELEQNVASKSLSEEVEQMVKADVEDVVSQVHGKAAELDKIATRTMEELEQAKKDQAAQNAKTMSLDWSEGGDQRDKQSIDEVDGTVNRQKQMEETSETVAGQLEEETAAEAATVENATAEENFVLEGKPAVEVEAETEAKTEAEIDVPVDTENGLESLTETDTSLEKADDSVEETAEEMTQEADDDGEERQAQAGSITKIFKEVLNPAQIEEIVALARAVRNIELDHETNLSKEDLPSDLELVAVSAPATPSKVDLVPDVSGLNPPIPSSSCSITGEKAQQPKELPSEEEFSKKQDGTYESNKATSGFTGASGDEKRPGLPQTAAEEQAAKKRSNSNEEDNAANQQQEPRQRGKKQAVDYTCIFDDDYLVEEESKGKTRKEKKKEKKRLAEEAKAAKKANNNRQELDNQDEENGESGEKKLWFLDTLIVILVIILIVLGIGIAAPNTYVGGKINNGFNWVVNKIVGGQEKAVTTKQEENKKAQTPKKSPLETAVDKANELHLSSIKLTANKDLNVPDWGANALAEGAEIKPYTSQVWYTSDDGKAVSYDDELIKAVYGYYSTLPLKIKEGSDEVLKYISPDSTLYAQTNDLEVNSDSDFQISSLEVGNIGYDGEYYYVPVIVKGNTTGENNQAKDVVKLKAENKEALIFDIATE